MVFWGSLGSFQIQFWYDESFENELVELWNSIYYLNLDFTIDFFAFEIFFIYVEAF